MAAATLPAPGSENDLGPCEPICAHTDCAAIRVMAMTPCRICRKAIGYETRFYQESDRRLVHAACLEEEVNHANSK